MATRYVVIFRGWHPVEARTVVWADSPDEAEHKAAEQIDWDWSTLDWEPDQGGEITSVHVRDVYDDPD